MSFTAANAAGGPDDADSLSAMVSRQQSGTDAQSGSGMKADGEVKKLLLVIIILEVGTAC